MSVSKATCQVCGKEYPKSQLESGYMIKDPIVDLIQKDVPHFKPGDYICYTDLNIYRTRYISNIIKGEQETLTQFEKDIVDNIENQELIVKTLYQEYDKRLTKWDKLADRIADFGGSWRFIGIFVGIMVLWIIINSVVLLSKPFDPYPFILLNLILSCLAALQAPVIMMSQNRQEDRDRLRAENDFKINLKAEIEIKILHEKVDHIINNQWQKLIEIQQIQIDLMEEMRRLNKE